jgi:hypothetical protein
MPRPSRTAIVILAIAAVFALVAYRFWRSSSSPALTPVAEVAAVRDSGAEMAIVFVHGVLSDPQRSLH